ncbi:prolyl oligopeptidase family serine peptidase [Roseiconus nitratireducens]|uniref:Prolyl oligopeptidase family serine peptidase n=1 Tax=Roseiconus nitratireducens TaxID=2605748 RepID=A0A5M6D373_9BACT|nr:prolyl oligopeptidase family serine peptidase [Roseiconus nitratireducens]
MIGTCTGKGALAEEPPARQLPRFDLLQYRDEGGQRHPVKSEADWQRRRSSVLQAMSSVMGAFDAERRRCPLDMQLVETVDCGSYQRQLIRYQSEPGCDVPAYLCVPKTALGPAGRVAPAVLCLHPTDLQHGHQVVVGIAGRPNRQYAAELAQRGFVTLSPSYPLMADYQPDLENLGWQSGTAKAIWDNRRGLDLLESLPFVRGNRFAAIGHSLGGHNAVYTACFDQRIAVIVSSCGLDCYVDYYDGDAERWRPGHGWCQQRYMPQMAAYQNRLQEIPFDFPELIGALAPRRTLIIAPKHDTNFRAASVDRIAAAARDVYRLLGVPDRLQVLHPDCDHDFPEAMRERAYRLIEETLAPDAPDPE